MTIAPLLWFFACASPAPAPVAEAPATPEAPAAPVEPAAPIEAAVGTANAATPAADLPDLTQNLKTGACESGPGKEGAEGYFAGDLTFNGNTVTGWEKWILFATSEWIAKGGKDCSITWTITGKVADKGACLDCDSGMSFHAEPQASDCPDELVHGHKSPTGQTVGGEGGPFDEKYAFKKDASGHVTVYFAKSGKRLAEGYHKDNRLNYLSDRKCNWF